MRGGKPRLTKSQKRLLKLFSEVDDEDIKEIMSEVLYIESRFRSAKNFPIRKIRDTVDSVARLHESKRQSMES